MLTRYNVNELSVNNKQPFTRTGCWEQLMSAQKYCLTEDEIFHRLNENLCVDAKEKKNTLESVTLFVLLSRMSRKLLLCIKVVDWPADRQTGLKTAHCEWNQLTSLEHSSLSPRLKANPDIRSITTEHFTALCFKYLILAGSAQRSHGH